MGAQLKRPGLNVRDRLITTTRRLLDYTLAQDSEWPGWSDRHQSLLDDLLAGRTVRVTGAQLAFPHDRSGLYDIEGDYAIPVREVSRDGRL